MTMLPAPVAALASAAALLSTSVAAHAAPSGDTCTATGNGTTYAVQITLPSNAVEQGAFAFGANGATITGIKISGNPGKYSTSQLPANASATWILTDPTYVAPGSQVSAAVTTSRAVGGSFTVVPATAVTTGQSVTYLDPINCPITKSTPPPSSNFNVRAHFAFSAGTWHFFVTVPGTGRVTVAGKSSPKLLIRTRTVPVKAGSSSVTIVPTAAGRAKLAGAGSLKLQLVVEFKPTAGKTQTKTIPVTLRK